MDDTVKKCIANLDDLIELSKTKVTLLEKTKIALQQRYCSHTLKEARQRKGVFILSTITGSEVGSGTITHMYKLIDKLGIHLDDVAIMKR